MLNRAPALAAGGQRVRNAPVAVDAGHALLRHRLVRTRRRGRLFCEVHGAYRVAAATLRGVVGLEFGPDLLRQLRPVRFIFGGRIEFAAHMAPHLGVGLNVTR